MNPTDRTPSLAATATENIREAIVTGVLRLGEALSEEKLALQFGMSRTPIREALMTLQAQGLITILPQRGSYVFQPDEAAIQALCEFRAIAECRAMWLAHARDRDGTLARLKAAQARMIAAHIAEDNKESAKADAAFHDAFLEGAGNPFLAQAYEIIAGRISAVRSMLLNPHEYGQVSAAEHDDIIAAFETASLSLADASLATHIMKMQVRYRATMANAHAQETMPRRRRRQSQDRSIGGR